MFPRLMAILALLALSACVLPTATGGKPAGANPVTGDAIVTTALDSPAPVAAGPDAGKTDATGAGAPGKAPRKTWAERRAERAAAKASAEQAAAAPPPDAAAPGPRPKPRPGSLGGSPAPEPALEAAAIPAPVAADPVPEEQKSPAQLACEKRGNIWAQAGESSVHTCVKRTGDSGKRCTTGKQCQGACLARSMTCSPYDPLLGCNDIIQDDGRRVTLCLN
ncbi:MAG: hypothetical protein R3D63_01735 [Paracoccaceae bacterium]